MTSERGRRWLQAALAGTGSSYPLGAAHRYVGWDGTSRYRGHERRAFACKQGGTVEYVFRISPLILVRGEIFIFTP